MLPDRDDTEQQQEESDIEEDPDYESTGKKGKTRQ
jgi:hypothetical protein